MARNSITLQNIIETDVQDNDILGQLCFAAPNEAGGTDAVAIVASIFARSEEQFEAGANATELVFVTSDSESSTPTGSNGDMTLSSAGLLTVVDDIVIKSGGTIGGDADKDLLTLGDGALTVAGTIAGTLADGVLATTQSSSDNSTKVATTAYADAAASGGGRSVTGTTDNGIITWVNSGSTFVSEANLTYDDTNGLKVTSATSALPLLTIENTNGDNTGGTLKFNKNGTSPADNDVVGNIDFVSEDSASNPTTYARIQSVATDITTTSEQGRIDFYVAETDGTLTKGMDIVGTGYDSAITVDISTHGSHANAGLKLGGTLITSSAAEINLLDGVESNVVLASKAVIYSGSGGVRGSNFLLENAGATTIMTLNNSGNDVDFDCSEDIYFNANGGNIYFGDDSTTTLMDFDVSSGTVTLKYQGGTGNYFKIAVGDNGVTTLSTVDNGVGVVGHLVLAPDGDLVLDPASNIITLVASSADAEVTIKSEGGMIFQVDSDDDTGETFSWLNGGGTERMSLTEAGDLQIDGTLTTDDTIFIKETSAANADVSAYGQLWVKTADPCQLYFTNEDGDDIQITSGDALAGGGSGDITSVVAGVGLSGGATDGDATLTVDFSEFSTVTPVNGDFLAALDSDGAQEQKTAVSALATLFAGTGLTATNSVIAVDAAQTQITSLGTLTTLTVDSVIINGTTIGHTSDTDLITLTSALVTVAGEFDVGANTDGHDVKFYGDTTGTYWMWDESADGVRLRGNFVQEAVPALNSGTEIGTGVAIIDIDWSKGNYHWIKLNDTDITNIIFRNGKRGGRYILRIEQASSAQEVAWTNFDYYKASTDEVLDATELRWVGGTAPTMSTGTSSTDVYGFLCTRSNGAGFDAFVVAQDLQDIIT